MTPRIVPSRGPGKQVGGLGGDRRAARPPGQAEKAGVQPQQQVLVGAGDQQGEDHAEDRDAIGQDRRDLAAEIVGQGAGDDDARHREEGAHAEHLGGIELVEADIDGEGELVQRHEKAAEPGEHIDREQQPEMRRAHRLAKAPAGTGGEARGTAAARGRLGQGAVAIPSANLPPGSARRNSAASGSTTAAITAACTR